jgi:PTH1 family peptidyl-tRNA hydrolase
MKLIIGLGNPGDRYQNTRHNFGFMAIDYFQKENNFSAWENAEKFNAEVSQGEINGLPLSENFGEASQKIILAKPQTFMNLSGQAVRTLADFYKIPAADILVVHDDIDLPLGVLRLAQDSGSAGHKGVRSIIKSLGTQNFARLRLGIKSSAAKSFWNLFKKSLPAEKFVLQNFSSAEKLMIKEMIKKAGQAIRAAIKGGVKEAQNQFNS